MLRCLFTLALVATTAHAETARSVVPGAEKGFIEASLGVSFLGETIGSSSVFGAAVPGVRGGIRDARWGLFGSMEAAIWWVPTGTVDETALQSALNIGLGGELLYADGYVRSSLVLGPSILLQGSELDEPGDVGFFLEFRGAGLRWAFDGPYVLVADPLSFSLIMPSLGGIPLVEIEYRSTVGLEYVF